VGDVGDARCSNRVLGLHARDSRGGERPEHAALPNADQDHRSATAVRYDLSADRRPSHAMPITPSIRPPAGTRALPNRRVSPGTGHGVGKVDNGGRHERQAGLDAAVARHALPELCGEEPEGHPAARSG
jgi:hypothetical protein